MPQFSAISKSNLSTCDQRLQDILNEAIKHIDFIIITGHRGQADQDKAYAEGRSKLKWPNGNHNAYPSRAVDIAPYVPDVKIDWRDVPAFGRLMGYIERIAVEKGIKLRFGMDWDSDRRTVGFDPDEKFLDAPHIELAEP
jgi:peptidoglycan L-alanyl-D-glutamate endopeptidase CwlK